MLEQYSFGYWLRLKRKGLDLTRQGLADRVGCSVSTIRKLEDEERHPSAQIAELLADIFKIPIDERSAFLRFARGDWSSVPSFMDEEAPWRASTPVSAQHHHSNLPGTFTSLIGRNKDIAAVRAYLQNPEIRLVTLIGPPGIGKTRLSLESARQALTDLRDGVFFVELAPLDQPSLIPSAILQTLGYVEQKERRADQYLVESIGHKRMLLVLDNCEHLVDDVAALASFLLSACPRLKILTTSRAALRIPGEWLYSVSALDIPKEDSILDTETLSEFPALTLFDERARAARTDFTLNAENIQAVASICTQLDGLPLAIELIAARIRWMSPQTLLEHMNDQFVLSADGLRAVPMRQKSLKNAIDWSFNLLSAEEQALFVRLSVFSGGFTQEAAESIFSRTASNTSIPDIIASLLDKSLLQRLRNEDVQPRSHMLVTIQHFALNHLRERNQEIEARNRHLDYFLNLAEEGEPHMLGHGQLEWLARLQPEANNFRAAFEWSFVDPGDSEKSLRLANALFAYWRVRSDYHEAQLWLDRVLNLPGAKMYPDAYAKALLSMGILKLVNVDPGVAEPLLSQSVTLARTLQDTHTLAEALDFLGLASALQKKFEHAHAFLEESQSIFRAANDRKGLALTNWHLGALAELEGRQAIAFEYREQSLVLFQEVGDILRQSVLLQSLGSYLLNAGDFEQGREMLRQALSMAYQLGSKLEMGHALSELSVAEKRMQNFTRAAQFLSFARRLFLECGAQADLLSLKPEFDRLLSHLDHSSIEAALTQAETWTLSEAITYVLEKDN